MNRFHDKEEATRFVQQLYLLGATRVIIPDGAIRDYEKLRCERGGACADSLVVTLPSDSQKREALLEFYVEEATNEGLEDETSTDSIIEGQYLYFWWD